MKIYELITWDMTTGEVLAEKSYDWDGQTAQCKGEAKKEDLALQKQSLDLAKQQSDRQNNIIQPITNSLNPYLSQNGIGFSPKQLADMQSMFLQQQGQRYDQAGSQVMSTLARRNGGIDGPVGGDWGKYLSALKGQQASSTAGGLQNIDLQNAQTALANKFNAAGILNHSASIFNPSPYTSLSGTANTNYTQAAMQPNPWMGVLGAGIGAAGSMFGGMFTPKPPSGGGSYGTVG